ncbi:TPA: DUF2528 family protein [Klebsiella oxytoca]|uniref:DUF2528 family protein n=1 Tax=Klebsiella oxytoca TaxID=571 RepID=A0AAN5LDT2_KLEOX|nr:DUF2528 family protein [Klebsiella oxytoca]
MKMMDVKTFKIQWIGHEDKPCVTIELEELVWTKEDSLKLVNQFQLARHYLDKDEEKNPTNAMLKLITCEMIYQIMGGNKISYPFFKHMKSTGLPMLNGNSGIRVLEVDRAFINPESLVITEIKEK